MIFTKIFYIKGVYICVIINKSKNIIVISEL